MIYTTLAYTADRRLLYGVVEVPRDCRTVVMVFSIFEKRFGLWDSPSHEEDAGGFSSGVAEEV